MPKKSKKIEKPWAVYSFGEKADGIGKVVQEDKYFRMITDFSIIYHKKDKEHAWDPRYVRTFDKSVKAVAYFLVHDYQEPKHSRNEVINSLLRAFPDERKDLEKFLSKNKNKPNVPNLYDSFRAVNPRRASEIDEEIRRIESEEIETDIGGGLHKTHTKGKSHPNKKILKFLSFSLN